MWMLETLTDRAGSEPIGAQRADTKTPERMTSHKRQLTASAHALHYCASVLDIPAFI